MAELQKLDYAGQQTAPRRWSKLAITAFVLGLMPGPLVVVNFMIAEQLGAPPNRNSELMVVWGTYLLTFSVNLVALVRLRTMPMHRGRGLAVAGMASTLAWAIGLFLFLAWAVSRI